MATLIAACTAGTLAGAVEASAATGGQAYFPTPTITKLQCAKGCAGGTAARRSGAVSVKKGATLVVRGRRMQHVARVVFLGRKGTGDNVTRGPRTSRSRSLKVVVPRAARTGRVRLVDVAGRKSRMSKARLRMVQPKPKSRFIWPVRGTLTSYFGDGRNHAGIDIAAPTGRAVRAVAGGRVLLAQWTGGYGNYVCVAHRRFTSCYAHLSRYGTRRGARVGQGEVVGRVGNTGNSTGPHLHFEIRRGTRLWGAPLNPMRLLPRRTRASASFRAPVDARPMDFDLPISGP